MKFEVVINLKTVGKYPTFDEAFKVFYTTINNMIKRNSMPLQLLETACWIEPSNSLPYLFYEARDKAYEKGLLKDGKLVDKD